MPKVWAGTTSSGRRLAPSSIALRLSALASFYRYCVRQRALTESPFFEVTRPSVSGSEPPRGDVQVHEGRTASVGWLGAVVIPVRCVRRATSAFSGPVWCLPSA